MIAVANVFPVGPGVVSLQSWLGELAWRGAGHFLPEPLGILNICRLMDLDAERQFGTLNPNCFQEAHEEEDQTRVTVNEDNPLKVMGQFPFRAFAPIGNRTSNQHFTVGEVAYLGSGGGNLTSP